MEGWMEGWWVCFLLVLEWLAMQFGRETIGCSSKVASSTAYSFDRQPCDLGLAPNLVVFHSVFLLHLL